MVNKSGIITLLLVLVVGGGVAWYVWDSKQPKTYDEFLAAAQNSMMEHDYKTAKKYALAAKEINPDDNRALLMASVAAASDGKLEDAIEILKEPNKDAEFYVDCVQRRGIVELNQGYTEKARSSFQEALEIEPLSFESNIRMFRLLRIEGRNWEARPYIIAINQLGQHSINAALVLSSIESVFIFEEEDKEFLETAQNSDSDYTMFLIGQARFMAAQGEFDRSLRMLDTVLEKYPTQIEAVAQKGRLLLSQQRMEEYDAWKKAFPPECLEHPLVWQTFGTKAELDDNKEMAARCFWEALRLYPHHSGSNTGLARVLRSLDRKREATPFAKRGRLTREFEERLTAGKPDESVIPEVVDKLEEMDRILEAAGWCLLGLQKEMTELETKMKELQAKLREQQKDWAGKARTIAKKDNPAEQIDLSDYPLPDGIAINYEID